MKVREFYMKGRAVEVNTGNIGRLWKDNVVGKIPFCEKFPNLFNACLEQDCTVDKVESLNPISSFRRRLSPELLDQWEEMKKSVREIPKNDHPDNIIWKLHSSQSYSTKSMYYWLEKDLARANYK